MATNTSMSDKVCKNADQTLLHRSGRFASKLVLVVSPSSILASAKIAK